MGLINLLGNRIGIVSDQTGPESDQQRRSVVNPAIPGSRMAETTRSLRSGQKEMGPEMKAPPTFGGSKNDIAGKIERGGSTTTTYVDHDGLIPCPPGSRLTLLGQRRNPTGDPADPSYTIHRFWGCVDELGRRDWSGGGGGGGGGGNVYAPEWNPLFPASTDDLAGLPEEVVRKAKELRESFQRADCVLDEERQYTDPYHPGRVQAECDNSERDLLTRRMAILLNNPYLNRFPGFADCIESQFKELKWCCHIDFQPNRVGPVRYDLNINFQTDDYETHLSQDDLLSATIKRAKNEGVVHLGGWFFNTSHSYEKKWFLVRLLGELCPLGKEGSAMDWTDAALLLEPSPESVVCSFLTSLKKNSPSAWKLMQEECEKNRWNSNEEGTVYHFKFFAINVCTGSVYREPVPVNSKDRMPALDEKGRPMTLGGDLGCIE